MAFLAPEGVIKLFGVGHAHAGGETDNGTCGNGVMSAVHLNFDILVRKIVVFVGSVNLDHKVSAAAVDDVLLLIPVIVVGSDLIFLDDHDFFGIYLFVVGIESVAVAKGKEEKTAAAEIARTEIGDVPTENISANFVILVIFFLPLLGGEICEGRKQELVLVEEGDGIFYDFVDFRTFHFKISFD